MPTRSRRTILFLIIVSVSTEFVKKTVWTFTLKCIQALWSILLLLYGVLTLNTRPSIQIDQSEDNGIHMEIKTDKRLRMYIVLHLPESMMLISVATKSGYSFDFKAMMRNQTINMSTHEILYGTNCADVPTRTRESSSIHHQQLKQSNDTILNYNNEIKFEKITPIENQRNTAQDILRMNEDRETRRNIKRDEQNIDYKATFQPNKLSLNYSRLCNEHNTTPCNKDMTGKTATNANHLQQDTDISNCSKKITLTNFGEDQKTTCRLYGKNEITDLDEIVKDDDIILNKKLDTSMILSKDAQCVSKINQNKCEESFTQVDYNNKSQENAVDINLKDNSLHGVHRKKMRLNRSRTQTRHNARQMTTKRVYVMVQVDVVGYMVLDFFSQKQWQERPHILWPSMHPLLLFKVIYLDENGNFL